MSNSKSLFPKHDHFISVDRSDAMRAKFRNEREKILRPEFQGKDVLAISETFNREVFDTILETEGCVGIRIYLGMDDDMKSHLILIGVDAENGIREREPKPLLEKMVVTSRPRLITAYGVPQIADNLL